MLDSLLAAIARLEKLQSQSWGMVMTKTALKPATRKPALTRDANLLTVTSSIGSTMVRFNPSLQDADRWELVSVDGSKPDERTRKAHRARYTGRSQKLPIEQLPPVREMVPHNTISLQGEVQGGYQLATFTPHIKLPVVGDIAKKLVGRIWYHVESDAIERIVVQNDAKLSPVPGLSITELHLGMRFGLVLGGSAGSRDEQGGQDSWVVLQESELLVVGKKLFKSFHQISHYGYSEHWMPES